LTEVNGYRAFVDENGIKNNLFRSLFIVLGKEKYNLLYANVQDGNIFSKDDNKLLTLFRQIQSARTSEDYISVYNYIYELYAEKIEKTLKTNQNNDNLFGIYAREIVQLQQNALFNNDSRRYLPGLERIISLIYEKAEEYYNYIEERISVNKSEVNGSEEDRRRMERFETNRANECMNNIKGSIEMMRIQRENQVLEYMGLTEKGIYIGSN